MALNPIVYTEKVVKSFLRYQLTAYPFADARLYEQMRQLLSLDETRRSPLLKGPYISLSQSFRQGGAVADLVDEGLLHAHLRDRIPAEITHLYGHQEQAIRAIAAGRTTLVSTGTGSGKTECFLYPIGTKLRRGGEEKPELVTQWMSERGDTTIRQIAKKWGVEGDDAPALIESLFSFLNDQHLLVPVRLKGSRGRPLPNVRGVYQVDADRLRLMPNHGVWRCRSCRRRTTRRTPHDRCPAWRCEGTLEFVREDSDNYDLQLLDQRYSMLRPEEHTAMVPHETRERLENLFKANSDAVNCFVCTPTLELGVDIGKLDAVLMRNVPPLPANYWQRAGRAGRRHRMAVDITYCRPVSHDRAYSSDPPKLLAGRVDPPAFNLRNDVMVGKHVHATVITRLHQYLTAPDRSQGDRTQIEETLRTCLPNQVSSYLFEEGVVRERPFDLAALRQLIARNAEDLVAYVERAFRQGWPEDDAGVTTAEALYDHVRGFVDGLAGVVARLQRRLNWALEQIRRLNAVRERHGDLEPEDEALFRRCGRLVQRLKGTARRTRREAEGYEDVNTFGVLAAEGFLPGYGLEVGSVLGTAEIPYWRTGARSKCRRKQNTARRTPAASCRALCWRPRSTSTSRPCMTWLRRL